MFTIHTLAFALWILVVDPHLVPSDDTCEKNCRIHSDTSWESAGRYPSIWTCGHLWIARKPTFHRLDENIVCCGWFHGWNHDWLQDDLPFHHHQLPFSYSESWHGLVQCSLLFPVGVDCCPIILHLLHLCYCFWTGWSIHTHTALVRHCSHIMQKGFDGFLPLVHLQPPKVDHCTFLFFCASSKWCSHINPAVAKWLFSFKIAVWKEHSVFICYYILLQYWDIHTPTPPS